MLELNLKIDIWTDQEKMSNTQFCTLKFDIMSTPLPKKDLINQIGELTSGLGTEKCLIIIFVFVMCQTRPLEGSKLETWHWGGSRKMSNN